MSKFPASNPESRRRSVVALVYNGLCTFEFGIVAEIFGLSRPELNCPWYEFNSVALERGPLTAAGGLQFQATATTAKLEQADTIVIPGWRGKDEAIPSSICHALQRAQARGVRLVSICSGVYVLAAAGLLKGKRVTTHWRYVDDFCGKYPEVIMELDSLYVADGKLLTSAGSSAGIDACLHLVRSDYGAEVANTVARRLVMHAHRQGGQRQFIEQPVPVEYEANRLSAVLDYVRENLDRRHSVASLANRAGMSTRTFQRRFIALTAVPVGKWISDERISRACTLLETSAAPLQEVAQAVGIPSIENLQYHFRKKLQVSPGQYRKRFETEALQVPR